MGDNTKGLYDKFRVERTDGANQPGRKHHGCQYFPLDLTHDPHAVPAILAYALSCETENPILAGELRQKAIRPALVARDPDGSWLHPACPISDDETFNLQAWLAGHGFGSAFVSMESDDLDDKLYERHAAEGSFLFWEPKAPDGDGWFLFALYDTEDGPHACFTRPLN